MFYAENVKAGANTVTVSHTLSGTLRFSVLEYKGVATSNSLDVTATGQATSASPSSGSASPSASGDLLLGAVVTGTDANVTAGSGFTTRDSVPTAGASRLMVQDRVQATAGATSGAATLAASNNWGAALAAFKAGVASLPGAPASPTPAAGATGASATMSLTWSATGATSYDVKFGTSNPPPAVSTSQSAATYMPATRASNTTYFWQVVARNSAGATNGSVWSFTTAASVSLPGAPASPSPSTGTTGVSTRPSLTWTATGATSYDVRFGTTNPPPAVASAQSTPTYSPATLANTTQYFWQVVARNSAGTTSGAVWSFTTGALTATPIALVQHTAKDAGLVPSTSLGFPSANIAGNWIAVVLRTSSSSDVVTVSDTNGNTYQKAVQLAVTVDPPTGLTLGIFYAENVRGGANSITVSHTISGYLRLSIVEYSGVATSNSLDVTATGQGTSASPATGSATPTANGDLLLGAVVTGMDANVTAGSGYAIRDSVPSAGAARLTVEDKGQPVAGAASSSATLAASDNWGAALATFRAALR